jgi:hypothetical protein
MKKIDSDWIDGLFREFAGTSNYDVKESHRGSYRDRSRSNSASASREGFYPNHTFDQPYITKKSPRGYTSRTYSYYEV